MKTKRKLTDFDIACINDYVYQLARPRAEQRKTYAYLIHRRWFRSYLKEMAAEYCRMIHIELDNAALNRAV